MAETIPIGAQALLMDSRDHVATAIQELRAGDMITYLHQAETKLLEVLEAIPFASPGIAPSECFYECNVDDLQR